MDTAPVPAPALPAQRIPVLGEVSEGAVQAPSDESFAAARARLYPLIESLK